MTSRDEISVGEERCRLLERHRIQVATDDLAVHVRIRDGAGALLSHLAATPARARKIATLLVRAADRLDPPAAPAGKKIEAVK